LSGGALSDLSGGPKRWVSDLSVSDLSGGPKRWVSDLSGKGGCLICLVSDLSGV
jgi:uncharacterized protein YodC (DUF2158 family)